VNPQPSTCPPDQARGDEPLKNPGRLKIWNLESETWNSRSGNLKPEIRFAAIRNAPQAPAAWLDSPAASL